MHTLTHPLCVSPCICLCELKLAGCCRRCGGLTVKPGASVHLWFTSICGFSLIPINLISNLMCAALILSHLNCVYNVYHVGRRGNGVFFTGWNESNSFTHLTLESNKALARSYLSPCGHRVDSKLRRLAARHVSDTLSNNWSSLIDLAVEDYVLNCLEKGGSSVRMNAVDIWITVWKLCLKMMAADLRYPALDPSGCVLLKFIFYKTLKVVVYCP